MSKWYNSENYSPTNYSKINSFQYHHKEIHPILGHDCWIVFTNGLPVGFEWFRNAELKVVTEQFYNTSNYLWYVRGEDGEFVDGLESKKQYEEIIVSQIP